MPWVCPGGRLKFRTDRRNRKSSRDTRYIFFSSLRNSWGIGVQESFSAVCAGEARRGMKQFNLVSGTFPLKNGRQKPWGRGWKQSPVINRPFRVSSRLCIKTKLSAQPLIWKWFSILMQIKLTRFLELAEWPILRSLLLWTLWGSLSLLRDPILFGSLRTKN